MSRPKDIIEKYVRQAIPEPLKNVVNDSIIDVIVSMIAKQADTVRNPKSSVDIENAIKKVGGDGLIGQVIDKINFTGLAQQLWTWIVKAKETSEENLPDVPVVPDIPVVDTTKWNRSFPDLKRLVTDPSGFMGDMIDFFIQKPDEITELVDIFNVFGFNIFTAEIGVPFPFSIPFLIRHKLSNMKIDNISKYVVYLLISLILLVIMIVMLFFLVKRFNIIQKIQGLV